MLPDPLEVPLMRPEEVSPFIRLGRSATYEAIARGDVPTVRIGRRVLVPTAALRRLLGIHSTTATSPSHAGVEN